MDLLDSNMNVDVCYVLDEVEINFAKSIYLIIFPP